MPLFEDIPVTAPTYLYRDGSSYLEAREVLRDAESKKQKAGYQPGTSVLEVRLDATHSGMLINGRTYPGKRMKAGARTWTDPYEKPVHAHHRSGKGLGDAEDPRGRAKKATYVQTVQGSLWEDDHKNPLPMGTGYIELVVHVTDQDTIQKVLDGRFQTVSQSFDTDGMYCSICDQDWYHGPGCEHVPGGRDKDGKKGKKGKPAHFYTGTLRYDEISFVNVPADPLALVHSAEFLKDAFQGFEPEDLTPAPLFFDSLVLDGKQYVVTKPEDKETIEISGNPAPIPGKEALTASSEEISDEQFAEAVIIRSMIVSGVADLDGLKADGYTAEKIDSLLKLLEADAKLSAKQRKKLKASAFCGPDRSFPVVDCAHYTAALRLLDRAKLSSDQKARVRACIIRRGKALGCPGAKEKGDCLFYEYADLAYQGCMGCGSEKFDSILGITSRALTSSGGVPGCASLCQACLKKIDAALSRLGPKVISQVVSEEVIKVSDVSFGHVVAAMKLIGRAELEVPLKKRLVGHLRDAAFFAAPTQEVAEAKREDDSMSQTENQEKKGDEAPAPAPTTDVAKLEKELAGAKDTVKAKDQEVKAAKDEAQALRDEVTKLAAEVQKNLARRLLDLRLKLQDPAVEPSRSDQKKYDETVGEYSKRARSSLEDAIKDEEAKLSFVAAKPAPASPDLKDIPRGSVTQKDAGVAVDTSKDAPRTSEDSKAKRPASAQDYKGGLASRFKSLQQTSERS